MLHVGIRTNVADATPHAAPAMAHGMVCVLLAKLMSTAADPLLFPIRVRLAVELLMVMRSLLVSLEGPVTYREMLMLTDPPLTAVEDGIWQLHVAGGLTAVPLLMPIANAVALDNFVPLPIAHIMQQAFVRRGAAKVSAPLVMAIPSTLRDLMPLSMVRLAPLLETLPRVMGMAVVAPGCNATLLLCVHMFELALDANMFMWTRVRDCRLA